MRIILFLALTSSALFAKTDPTYLLDKAIKTNNFKLAKKAIKKGANVNLDHAYGTQGMRPLINSALRKGRFSIAKLMINTQGFNPNLATSTTNVINVAIKTAPIDIVLNLFELGANKNSNNGLVRSPFEIASREGRTELVKFMLEDYDFNISEGGRFCALRLAAKFNKGEIFNLIKNSSRYNELTSECLEGTQAQIDYNETH